MEKIMIFGPPKLGFIFALKFCGRLLKRDSIFRKRHHPFQQIKRMCLKRINKKTQALFALQQAMIDDIFLQIMGAKTAKQA